MAHYGPQEWFYATGELAANQRAAVFGPGDQNTFAPIFSDPGLTTPLDNPTTTDGSGNLEFYAADGEYWVFVGPVGTGDSVLVNLGAPAGPVFTVDDVGPDGDGNVPLGALTQSMADAKGDILAATGPDTIVRVPVGADTFVLTADSGAAAGVSWQAGGGGGGGIPTTIIDAKGDLIAGSAPDTPVRVGVGTDGQVLRADSGATPGVAWDTLTAADVGSVPTTRNVNTQNGITGGGALSVDLTLEPDYGTAANTVAEGNDPRIVNAVPNTRTLTAGIALSGGGDLSTDRTFDVDLGTTAGTAAAGDDARITGAQQRSTITTKGDLYAGTGAATTVRQGVGTDGQVLRANSAQASGLEYHTLTASDVGGVPSSRLISTTNGLQGGGDLSADRTLQPTYGTGANTVAQGNDTRIVNAIQGTLFDAKGDLIAASAADTPARLAVGTDGQYLRAASGQSTGLEYHTIVASDVGAVPTTRTITTQNGLTGGGDLSADRTLEPVYGTAVNTVAQGNDSRIVNAIQQTLLDAKGDIIVATANDTPARQAIGTNGDILTADSALTNGLKWAIEKSAGMYPRANYVPVGGVVTTRSSKAATLNALFYIPFLLLRDATLSGIAFEVSGISALAVVRAGIYAPDSSFLPSGAAVADYGTTDASTTGTKTFSVSTALTAGLWFLALVGQTAAPTLRHCAGWSPFVASATFPTGTGVGWNNAWVQTGVSGSLPTVGSITDTDCPMAGVKF